MKITAQIFSDLVSALGIDSDSRCIALIGAGGKTSLMYALAKEFVEKGKTVISTTSTKISPPNSAQSPCLILIEDIFPNIEEISTKIRCTRHITVGLNVNSINGKILGVSAEQIFSMLSWADYVIVEADGAAGRPIKAPAASEPVIPDFADLVIPVVGLDSVFAVANQESVFRLEEFFRITHLEEDAIITIREIAKLFILSHGALRNIPEKAKIKVFLNKFDKLGNLEIVSELVERILAAEGNARVRSVVSGSLMFKTEVFTRFIRCLS